MHRSVCDEIRGVWIADETLSQVCDISSQWKQKLRPSKQRSRIIKNYDPEKPGHLQTVLTEVNYVF